jgi:hypothetical protein
MRVYAILDARVFVFNLVKGGLQAHPNFLQGVARRNNHPHRGQHEEILPQFGGDIYWRKVVHEWPTTRRHQTVYGNLLGESEGSSIQKEIKQ